MKRSDLLQMFTLAKEEFVTVGELTEWDHHNQLFWDVLVGRNKIRRLFEYDQIKKQRMFLKLNI